MQMRKYVYTKRVGQGFFFAGFGKWYVVTNHKQKTPSEVYIALSKCWSHQLHC